MDEPEIMNLKQDPTVNKMIDDFLDTIEKEHGFNQNIVALSRDDPDRNGFQQLVRGHMNFDALEALYNSIKESYSDALTERSKESADKLSELESEQS